MRENEGKRKKKCKWRKSTSEINKPHNVNLKESFKLFCIDRKKVTFFKFVLKMI